MRRPLQSQAEVVKATLFGGLSFGFQGFLNHEGPYYQKPRLVLHEFFEVSYGRHSGRHLPVFRQVDAVPAQIPGHGPLETCCGQQHFRLLYFDVFQEAPGVVDERVKVIQLCVHNGSGAHYSGYCNNGYRVTQIYLI